MQQKTHTTNYTDTLIEAAEDCPVDAAQAPPQNGKAPTVAALQYEMLCGKPYAYTSDEVLFRVHAERNGLSGPDLDAAREAFFSKGQPCFRASPLTKRYGFGVHFDGAGRMALYGKETPEYARFRSDGSVKKVKAMRSARK